MGGLIRVRVSHQQHATPFLNFLFVPRAKLTRIASGTGWRIAR